MRVLLFLSLLLILFACSPPTKQEAIDYLGKVRYEICDDILFRLDEQHSLIGSYVNNPKKLIDGPTGEEHTIMLATQKKNLKDLRACLVELEKVDVLGDEAGYLEAMKLYLYTRVRFEEEVMLKFVKKLKDGMTPEESSFLRLFSGRMIEFMDQKEKLASAEENFIEEFKITDEELDALFEQYFPDWEYE